MQQPSSSTEWVPVPIVHNTFESLMFGDEVAPPASIIQYGASFRTLIRPCSHCESENVPQIENEIASKDHLPEEIQFTDQQAIKDYICVICLNLAKNPKVHAHQKCKTVMCDTCWNTYKSMNKNKPMIICPLRCSTSRFTPAVLPGKGPRSWQHLGNLLLRCKFSLCPATMKYKNYQKHIDKCEFNQMKTKTKTDKANKRRSFTRTVSLHVTIS